MTHFERFFVGFFTVWFVVIVVSYISALIEGNESVIGVTFMALLLAVMYLLGWLVISVIKKLNEK